MLCGSGVVKHNDVSKSNHQLDAADASHNIADMISKSVDYAQFILNNTNHKYIKKYMLTDEMTNRYVDPINFNILEPINFNILEPIICNLV